MFQSTRPRRGAIRWSQRSLRRMPVHAFQSTRPRRGAIASSAVALMLQGTWVSIHAPPEGRDSNIMTCCRLFEGFQSTRPRRGAISTRRTRSRRFWVSIHAPPEGRDQQGKAGQRARRVCFNHAPPEGRDVTVCIGNGGNCSFNPRAPGGARFKR